MICQYINEAQQCHYDARVEELFLKIIYISLSLESILFISPCGRKAHFLVQGSSREMRPPWKRRLLAGAKGVSALLMSCTSPRRAVRQLQKMKSLAGSPPRSCCPGISSAEPMPTCTMAAGNWLLCGSLASSFGIASCCLSGEPGRLGGILCHGSFYRSWEIMHYWLVQEGEPGMTFARSHLNSNIP